MRFCREQQLLYRLCDSARMKHVQACAIIRKARIARVYARRLSNAAYRPGIVAKRAMIDRIPNASAALHWRASDWASL
jgi:hypothetical protein